MFLNFKTALLQKRQLLQWVLSLFIFSNITCFLWKTRFDYFFFNVAMLHTGDSYPYHFLLFSVYICENSSICKLWPLVPTGRQLKKNVSQIAFKIVLKITDAFCLKSNSKDSSWIHIYEKSHQKTIVTKKIAKNIFSPQKIFNLAVRSHYAFSPIKLFFSLKGFTAKKKPFCFSPKKKRFWAVNPLRKKKA